MVLVAEREQGITIDVAHIYFSTDTHKFIIADSPGHVEYTRNMVTGASTAETSIILVDARKGLLEQSYRHFFVSQLLQLKRVIFCVNKMDLVEYSEDAFLSIAVAIEQMVKAYGSQVDYTIVPISSLKGDNVVHASEHMTWYTGKTLNTLLQEPLKQQTTKLPLRFDVQYVIHAQEEGFVDYRGYAGSIISGSVKVGDEIVALPSEKKSTVTEIRRAEQVLEQGNAGDSVTLTLADEIDISRGTLLTKVSEQASNQSTLHATLVWMNEQEGRIGDKLILKAGSRSFPVKLQQINYLLDPIKPGERIQQDVLTLNDIAQTTFKLSQPAFLDSYTSNKQNGTFILIHPQTNNTIAIGFVQ